MKCEFRFLEKIVLSILTLIECFIAGFIIFFFAVFFVTVERKWFYAAPTAIIAINLLSIPLYIYVLKKGWRIIYNICMAVLVTNICFYGTIEWAESTHALKGTKELLVTTIMITIIAISGIVTSIIISRKGKIWRKSHGGKS